MPDDETESRSRAILDLIAHAESVDGEHGPNCGAQGDAIEALRMLGVSDNEIRQALEGDSDTDPDYLWMRQETLRYLTEGPLPARPRPMLDPIMQPVPGLPARLIRADGAELDVLLVADRPASGGTIWVRVQGPDHMQMLPGDRIVGAASKIGAGRHGVLTVQPQEHLVQRAVGPADSYSFAITMGGAEDATAMSILGIGPA
jgi:hypothetical protein